MTSTSSTSATSMLTAAVVARDALVRSLLLKNLRECRVRVLELAVEELTVAVPRFEVVCTGPRVAGDVLALNVATLVVTRGLQVSDKVWADLARRRPVVIEHDDLTPVTLLEGLLRARFGIDPSDPPASLSWVPPDFLRGFLHSPHELRTIREFSRTSDFTVKELRAIEKDVDCARWEQLVTRLRAGVYEWLVGVGVDRRLVEEYLVIEDRSHFYRACKRAKIAVPWRRGR